MSLFLTNLFLLRSVSKRFFGVYEYFKVLIRQDPQIWMNLMLGITFFVKTERSSQAFFFQKTYKTFSFDLMKMIKWIGRQKNFYQSSFDILCYFLNVSFIWFYFIFKCRSFYSKIFHVFKVSLLLEALVDS